MIKKIIKSYMKNNKNIKYDYSKLRGKIVEVFGNQDNFAKAIGLSDRSVTFKLNNQRDFKQTDIETIIKVLGIGREDIILYFYTPKDIDESVKLTTDNEEF